MARYSKNKSGYIQQKKFQLINDGTIIERDWNTIGERQVIEPGKRKFYYDSGFLFTESNKPGVKLRSKASEWSEPYTEDKLSINVNDDVNVIKLPDTQDIRDYAYYGSAVELVRASLENIVKWFPGKSWSQGEYLVRFVNDIDVYYLFDIITDGHHNYSLIFDDKNNIIEDTYEPQIYLINNPFQLDFVKTEPSFNKYDNDLRNIPFSWRRYYMKGCKIISYNVWKKAYNECDKDYTVLYDITIKYEVAPNISKYNKYYTDYNPINIEYDDACINVNESNVSYYEGHIYGIKLNGGVVWCTNIEGFNLTPKPKIIDDYFDNLNGFERILLNRKSSPLYSCTLKTPIKVNDINYMVNRVYTFPSNGYCILCDNLNFDTYVNSLYNLSQTIDEEYADNIWRKMTHESIKTMDWSNENDEYETFDGGRLKDVLRIYGRFFDDIKRYIDNIKLKNCITLDGIDNLPSAELSDKAQLNGWEVYSTKLTNTENLAITDEYINNHVTKQLSRWQRFNVDNDNINFICDSQPKWFYGLTANGVTQNDVDINFMRLLATQSPYIFQSKGTRRSIEMVLALFGFGIDEFEFEERYYVTKPRKSEDVVNVYVKNEQPSNLDSYLIVETSIIDYVDNIGSNQLEPHITINGEYFDLKPLSFKTLCEFVNEHKIFTKNYNNVVFSGVPLKEAMLNNTKYIIPYFSQEYIYDGNVQFQSKGGWGKSITINDIEIEAKDPINYMETLPYTETLSTCNDLLLLNRNEIKNKTLFYVTNIADITIFGETDLSKISHYFKLIDKDNPQLINSWRNIPIFDFESSQDYDLYCNEVITYPTDDETTMDIYPLRPLYYGIHFDDYLLTIYNDNIIFDNIGNNPHTGNGIYDLGLEYKQYLEQPFYYSLINDGFNEDYIKLMAREIRFDIEEQIGEKIIINNNVEENYYLPNKLLIITQKLAGNPYFDEYFKGIIVKYLTQVIPATTILVFK